MSKSSTESSPQSSGQLLPNQKVRTTCNACQQAKIRCSHSHPCDRCVGHGFECIYSISQPLGRPAKRKTSRSTLAIQARRAEKDIVGRPTRRNAVNPSRSIAKRERQGTSRLDVSVKSSPLDMRELNRSNSSIEMRCPEAGLNVLSGTEDLAEILGKLPSRGWTQAENSINSADETKNNVDSGMANESLEGLSTLAITLDSPGQFDFQHYSQFSLLDFTSPIESHSPNIGLMLDEPPVHQSVDGESSAVHTAMSSILPGLNFKGDAAYQFSLAPNARHMSGTVQGPWRIMEFPYNEERRDQPDTSSSQLSPQDAHCEFLWEDSSSIHCI